MKSQTLHAFYDYLVAPVSFDFLTFAVEAERIRRQKGLARLHVTIVPADTIGNIVWRKSAEQGLGQWRLHQILIQIMTFLPGEPSLTVLGDRREIDAVFADPPEVVFPTIIIPRRQRASTTPPGASWPGVWARTPES